MGVTEAGIAKGELAMDVLDETLYRYFCHHGADTTLCVINTDNLRNNGDVIRDILCNAYPKRSDDYAAWLETNVGFLNEMGDRLVPQVYAVPDEIQAAARAQIRGQDELITYAETLPATPLILEDLDNMLRVPFGELDDYGVIVSQESIEPYHDWKLLLGEFRACTGDYTQRHALRHRICQRSSVTPDICATSGASDAWIC